MNVNIHILCTHKQIFRLGHASVYIRYKERNYEAVVERWTSHGEGMEGAWNAGRPLGDDGSLALMAEEVVPRLECSAAHFA
ncbi:uncharacterized protein VTP21DRAFT_2489 [Calcarisporiella thermophila]|uniref:uncharacterized protein n=1 Tax=Calcarisporiella thermophila TaxID=911321 RepID=UPI0037423478